MILIFACQLSDSLSSPDYSCPAQSESKFDSRATTWRKDLAYGLEGEVPLRTRHRDPVLCGPRWARAGYELRLFAVYQWR
jgi:hypothetical protein